MEQRLEPLERLTVVEDDGSERAAVDLAGGIENTVPDRSTIVA